MIRSIADLQQMKEAYLEKMGQYTHLCMVCYGTGCMSSGCKNVRDAMVEELEKAGLSDKVAVIERGCMGTCAVGPVVYVLPDETYYTEMTPERVKDVVQKHFIGGEPVTEYTFYDSIQKKRVSNIHDVAFFRDQVRIALRNCGLIDVNCINSYVSKDGYLALARILEMVQNASERKAPAELFIRKFARIYTPVVTGLAVLIVLVPWIVSWVQPDFSFVLNDWLYRALVFLVISCPCALVVSIPLGYFGGIGAASRQGILFKGGNYLDAITKINTVVFDKTGTLTKGVFEVQQVHVREGFTEEEVVRTIASVESRSNHPIAKAVEQYAKSRQISIRRDVEVSELAGYGLKTLVDGQEVLVGNTRLLEKYGISFPSELTGVPETLVVCAVNGEYVGHLLLADTVKEDAKEAVAALKKLNIDNIQILSGDKQTIVSKLAGYLGVDEAYGDLLPEDKVAHVEALKSDPGRRVAFVGDGINDAPVLALSDVGVAMGGLGSDAAIEIADVVLQTDQPGRLAMAIRIGKETRRIIWQNITLAFGVKLIVLVLGAGGLATMWEAVFADVGVALLAILNAIRIQKRAR